MERWMNGLSDDWFDGVAGASNKPAIQKSNNPCLDNLWNGC
jgi:hypothetical protein